MKKSWILVVLVIVSVLGFGCEKKTENATIDSNGATNPQLSPKPMNGKVDSLVHVKKMVSDFQPMHDGVPTTILTPPVAKASTFTLAMIPGGDRVELWIYFGTNNAQDPMAGESLGISINGAPSIYYSSPNGTMGGTIIANNFAQQVTLPVPPSGGGNVTYTFTASVNNGPGGTLIPFCGGSLQVGQPAGTFQMETVNFSDQHQNFAGVIIHDFCK